MRQSSQYPNPKMVQWSEEDRCYVGQCPGVIGPCCHGDDASEVYSELCRIVDEWIEIMKQGEKKQGGKPSPVPLTGEHFFGSSPAAP
ncbi:MAG: hypothetical protein BECKG1743D_GA0114223_111761 [Candidatus Kentron sp. G]|nr:MAG: hypothetical protein BECKG1743F_GA0114225_111781 [Candidatus Kentron sp. G]VFN07373.1 MAG: hypothetical protein BECKG1743E_GA0114224_111971 [Candidatus Kentron sp. G]VFN07882.1 MAG: hypothetical protein BECKG1743D_GA0114223_111761 [Candidatus Kentron sp. G]